MLNRVSCLLLYRNSISLRYKGNFSLEYPEDWNLVISTSSTLPFAPHSKTCLIHFDFALEKLIRFRTISHDRCPDHIDGRQSCRITDPQLLSDLPGRNLQFKKLKDPKPDLVRNFNLINPAVREVVKGIAAALAAVFFASNPVDFIAATSCAKNMAILPAELTEV